METIMRVRTLLLLAVLGVVVAAIAATTAAAQQDNVPSPQAARDAHTSYAAVSAGGALDPTQSLGQGPTGATNWATGLYTVEFDHRVANCAYAATLGESGTLPLQPGEIAVSSATNEAADPLGEIPNPQQLDTRVIVQTFNSAGTRENRAFFLTVSCPDIDEL